MKPCLVFIVILLAGVAVGASAASCSGTGTRLNGAEIGTALGGKRIDATAVVVGTDGKFENWKEDHCSGGELWKVGAGTTIDPRVKTGSWAVVGSGTDSRVQYNYDGGSTYEWGLWQQTGGGLCWGNPTTSEAIARGTTSAASCP